MRLMHLSFAAVAVAGLLAMGCESTKNSSHAHRDGATLAAQESGDCCGTCSKSKAEVKKASGCTRDSDCSKDKASAKASGCTRNKVVQASDEGCSKDSACSEKKSCCSKDGKCGEKKSGCGEKKAGCGDKDDGCSKKTAGTMAEASE